MRWNEKPGKSNSVKKTKDSKSWETKPNPMLFWKSRFNCPEKPNLKIQFHWTRPLPETSNKKIVWSDFRKKPKPNLEKPKIQLLLNKTDKQLNRNCLVFYPEKTVIQFIRKTKKKNPIPVITPSEKKIVRFRLIPGKNWKSY